MDGVHTSATVGKPPVGSPMWPGSVFSHQPCCGCLFPHSRTDMCWAFFFRSSQTIWAFHCRASEPYWLPELVVKEHAWHWVPSRCPAVIWPWSAISLGHGLLRPDSQGSLAFLTPEPLHMMLSLLIMPFPSLWPRTPTNMSMPQLQCPEIFSLWTPATQVSSFSLHLDYKRPGESVPPL